jgi:putative glutamine amidotransferase
VLGVNSLHHQGTGIVGSGLRVAGWADDGTIEALEGTDGQRVLGLQWHPELLLDEPGHTELFEWLVVEAARPQGLEVAPDAAAPAAVLASAAA